MISDVTESLPDGPYVVLGGPPFEPSANQTSLQMFDAIGSQHPVLYVCRRYQGSIIRRIFKGALGRTSTKLGLGLSRLDENRFLLVLPWLADLLPLIHPETSRKLVSLVIRHSIRRTISRLRWESPVLVSYWWMFPELVSMDIWRHRVFDVIDRHWGYAYELNTKVRQRNFDLTAETARVSDKVVCVSEGLVAELSGSVVPQLLPNAIDLERVKRLAVNEAGLRSNTAVYAGGWNERLDLDLLAELVRRNPEWQFAFVGAVPDERFSHFSNVKFFGDVPYDTVLRELSNARIGLIPFVSNSFTESSSFLKILDYLACGVTVGATDLASLREWNERHPDRFKILENIEDWDELFSRAGAVDLQTRDILEGGDMTRYGTMTRALSLVSAA